VALLGGGHQCGAAVAGLLVDLRPAPQQQLDRPLVAAHGGAHQQRDATHAASLVRRVGPPATVKPRQQRRVLASLSCCHDLIGDFHATVRRLLRRLHWPQPLRPHPHALAAALKRHRVPPAQAATGSVQTYEIFSKCAAYNGGVGGDSAEMG